MQGMIRSNTAHLKHDEKVEGTIMNVLGNIYLMILHSVHIIVHTVRE